ncbi:MAG TPA: adenylate/guanylate cyclase domain-containing protein, partial [Acidimicrobiia bacterium]|nr:adenylate/guanylate cyclase domain-containing protein [Acidimicrobiia bacterium]
MAVLPTGTVTFLFTDIESSTRLWDRHPDAMPSALAGHDAIVRDAIEDQGGVVFATSGDGFAAAFAGADRAVAATITAQLRLQQEEWPAGVELRVRMGLHAGAAEERDGDYFGPTVNHTARLMAAAHGGQVLCSSAAAELVSDRVELLDLGVHRLRDLESVTHIWQVVGPGLPSVFPPLRTLDAFRSNLPHDLSVFIGRDEHVETVVDALRHGRVVSIVGVGGVGKTRLALRVGAELLPEFTDGVWLCELANVREPEELPDAVAAALGVIPAQGLTVTQGLCRFFAAKQLLLILDNCEHLLGAVAGFVTDTCAAAAKLAVLTTSREALALRGEHTHPLPSLALLLDDAPATIAASEAGALFVDRARDVRGDFTVAATTPTRFANCSYAS